MSLQIVSIIISGFSLTIEEENVVSIRLPLVRALVNCLFNLLDGVLAFSVIDCVAFLRLTPSI